MLAIGSIPFFNVSYVSSANQVSLKPIIVPKKETPKRLILEHFVVHTIDIKKEIAVMNGRLTTAINYINNRKEFGKIFDASFSWDPTQYGDQLEVRAENLTYVYIITIYGEIFNSKGKGALFHRTITYVPNYEWDGIIVTYEDKLSGHKSTYYRR